MKVKFGIKASAMLSSLMLATAFVAGCTEDTPPAADKAAPSPPVVAPKADAAPAPPVTAPKTEEKK